jgi:hypothetical protein
MDQQTRDMLAQERERAREWHELVNKVALLQQTISFQQQQIHDLRDRMDDAIKARDAAIDNLRKNELLPLATALDEKYDKEAFDEWKTDTFSVVKNKAEASSQFQTKAMVLVSVLIVLVPAIVTGIIKHFWP